MVQSIQDRIANFPDNSLHQLSNILTDRFSLIARENLNVKGMLANSKLARAISALGFYEFRCHLEYKFARPGGKDVIVDHRFPSSKRCSICGSINKDLRFSGRNWECGTCESLHDRDFNAAINILDHVASGTVSSS